MEELKQKAIEEIIDSSIKNFAVGISARHIGEVENPTGTINSKKNNVFIAELGTEFMFYSALVRSFDSSFGTVLENMGNSIAKISYEVRDEITSYFTPNQEQHIDFLIREYQNGKIPEENDYLDYNIGSVQNYSSNTVTHQTDNYFYDSINNCHIIIELKAGGNLDNKKAPAEKRELLREYFLLQNSVPADENIKIYFATAYNMFGEGNDWKQPSVNKYFADGELLIGKSYWNFVCNDEKGFEIIMNQYRKSAEYIKKELKKIKHEYGL